MKAKEYREKIAEAFLESLEDEPKQWQKKWKGLGRKPVNAVTGKPYKGINRLWLNYWQSTMGYADPRWCTFNQAQKQNWHIMKGSKGTQIEYWMPYDTESKKALTWKEYNRLQDRENIRLRAKYFTVFHASQIEGMPELEIMQKKDIHVADIITTISENMGVEILHDGGDEAYYSTLEDKIHMPDPGCFENEYAFHSTTMHELSHATGHSSRLNRYLDGGFGDEYYAYEELVAEISSCFMSEDLPMELDEEHFDNHIAYLQSWISGIRRKPEVLMKAIKDAERAADYLELQAGLCTEMEYRQHAEKAFEVSEGKVSDYQEPDRGALFKESNQKAYVKDFITEYLKEYDFNKPQIIKGKLLPSMMLEKELQQGGMFDNAEECLEWINHDPEAAANTMVYCKEKYPELDLVPEKDPRKFSLIMMERELYKMTYSSEIVDRNWDRDFLFDRFAATQICKDNGIKVPENAKVLRMRVPGIELD